MQNDDFTCIITHKVELVRPTVHTATLISSTFLMHSLLLTLPPSITLMYCVNARLEDNRLVKKLGYTTARVKVS